MCNCLLFNLFKTKRSNVRASRCETRLCKSVKKGLDIVNFKDILICQTKETCLSWRSYKPLRSFSQFSQITFVHFQDQLINFPLFCCQGPQDSKWSTIGEKIWLSSKHPRNFGSDRIVRTDVSHSCRPGRNLTFQATARFGGKSYDHPNF